MIRRERVLVITGFTNKKKPSTVSAISILSNLYVTNSQYRIMIVITSFFGIYNTCMVSKAIHDDLVIAATIRILWTT